jgi:hypothetical protein
MKDNVSSIQYTKPQPYTKSIDMEAHLDYMLYFVLTLTWQGYGAGINWLRWRLSQLVFNCLIPNATRQRLRTYLNSWCTATNSQIRCCTDSYCAFIQMVIFSMWVVVEWWTSMAGFVTLIKNTYSKISIDKHDEIETPQDDKTRIRINLWSKQEIEHRLRKIYEIALYVFITLDICSMILEELAVATMKKLKSVCWLSNDLFGWVGKQAIMPKCMYLSRYKIVYFLCEHYNASLLALPGRKLIREQSLANHKGGIYNR